MWPFLNTPSSELMEKLALSRKPRNVGLNRGPPVNRPWDLYVALGDISKGKEVKTASTKQMRSR